MIEQGRHQSGDRTLTADVVVVGSGAAGAMAARELARRGAKVVVLEEGPLLRTEDMTQREDEMMPLLYQGRGGRMTMDRAIRVLGGRSLGGGTVQNMCLCKRTPPEILELWARKHAVSGLSARELEPVFRSVEADLAVVEIPAEERNANNQVLERGVKALGWRGGPLQHNRSGCLGVGFCELGCPFDAKQNASKVLIPDAVDHGAHVLSDIRVSRVAHDGREARGVVGAALGADGRVRGRVEVKAAAVVLAGSAIGSAVIAGRSRLPDPNWRLGRGLRLHPGVAVAGLFPEVIEGHKGIPQSYECTEWLDHDEGSDRRIWIITAFAHPIGTSIMLPGFGRRHHEWMLRYTKLAALTAMLHDEDAGQVGVLPDGRARISYRLGDGAVQKLARGIRACARLLFAGGASQVLVPSIPPFSLETPEQVEQVPDSAAGPHNIAITSVHPMGTLALGDDPRHAVVKSTGEHHQLQRLFVLDSSLFPTSIGGPPQLSIYTFARHLSRHVAERAGR